MISRFDLAPGVAVGGSALPLIAGPCVVESEELAIEAAQIVKAMSFRLSLPVIYKSSYDKANRSSIDSFRGLGLEVGLEILATVRQATGLPILTDVHEPSHCDRAARVCDVLQIPAFLCRQTDLLVAAGGTGRSIAVKKGQFMAPEDMPRVVEKLRSAGAERVVVIERGCSFGYRNLIVDMRSFSWMHEDGIPVFFDVTHSLQLPGAGERESGGDRRFAEPLARGAIAAGADGLFLEVHPRPEEALCDSATQLSPDRAETLLASAAGLHRTLQAEGPLV
jgi:2-dehydro-3-deoxyphosphooctonate aldolase (KDO 8-P synthase)